MILPLALTDGPRQDHIVVVTTVASDPGCRCPSAVEGMCGPGRPFGSWRVHMRITIPSEIESEAKDWQDLANCLGVDPDLFFPERGASTREAKEVCRGCVVRGDCLEYALVNGEKFGIWGGMSERERRRIRRERALARRAAG